MRISRSLLLQLAWHALAILILASLPLLKSRLPWWDLTRHELLKLAFLLGAYGTSALVVMSVIRTEGARAALRALGITLSIFSVFLLVLMMARSNTPRYLLLAVFAAAIVAPLAVASRKILVVGVATLAAAFIAVAALSARALATKPDAEAQVVESTVKTAFYALRVVSHENAVPRPATRGGGLDRFAGRILLGTGDGRLYLLALTGDELKVQELPARVPANREEFARAFGGSPNSPLRSADYAETTAGVRTWRFRVADVIAQIRGDGVRIFASHHFWKQQEQCMAVRVSQLEANLDALEDSMRSAQWQTLYESTPCLPMSGPYAMRSKNPFRGEEIGGRMALVDPDTLLVTLGDQGFSGIESVQRFSQDPETAYGKTIRIDLNTRASRIFTLGHRNPQGLYVSGAGRIWQTEHAAQGGDEINILDPGGNYGWPLATYGTDYGSFVWPLSLRQNHHDGFVEPVHVWTPGIGVSNLIEITRDKFPIWRGDLLVGSLSTRSLYRIVANDVHVLLSEPIAVGKRVRDLLELDDGRILLWSDEGSLDTLEPAHAQGPAMRFAVRCSGCHRINDGLSHRMGPDLHRLMQREVATAARFDAYSPALRSFGGKWNKKRLDAFLRDPQGTVPGTTMAFEGVADEKERAQIVDYLVTTSGRGGL